jgi:hypothetical protein
MAVTAADKIEGLRQWASRRCPSADRTGGMRVERRAAEGGCRESCGLDEAAVKTPRGAGPCGDILPSRWNPVG